MNKLEVNFYTKCSSFDVKAEAKTFFEMQSFLILLSL